MAAFDCSPYRIWLLDLDGTLVDSAPDLHGALNAVLDQHGHDIVTEDSVRDWVGAGARVLLERALAAQHPGRAPRELGIDTLHADFLTYYEAHIADLSRPYPGVVASLERLRADGVLLGVVTNKYEGLSNRLLAALELQGHFDTVIGGDTLPERKPHASPLLEACRRLGGTAADALMVGDSITDVRAARAAGMPVVCVSYGYNHGEDIRGVGADAVVDSLSALF